MTAARRRRQLRAACTHELAMVPAPGNFARSLCRVFGHRWKTCYRHMLRWCERCDEWLAGRSS